LMGYRNNLSSEDPRISCWMGGRGEDGRTEKKKPERKDVPPGGGSPRLKAD